MASPHLNAVRNKGTRQDTWQVVLIYEGNNWGLWDKKTGGATDSDEVTYYPGGMADRISLGGRVTYDNVTLQRLYDGIDDHQYINDLLNGVGKGHCEIHQRPMDINRNPYGKSVVWIGTLKRVLVPDVDSEATAAAMLELEITIGALPQAK